MWRYPEDNTQSVLTARGQLQTDRAGEKLTLPETAVLFYMNGGMDYIARHYETAVLTEKLPRFLKPCPVMRIVGRNRLCFLEGGTGAPMAADTLEALAALGARNVVSLGMFGTFDDRVNIGDIVVPPKAFVEEGTSLHYYESIEYAEPDGQLLRLAVEITGGRAYPIVSTDAVYRQTFYKEALWREKGAVGVDMETSALFSVGRYRKLRVVSILIASDKHPIRPGDPQWQWHMTREMRQDFFARCLEAVFRI